jgi:hypothetical protein
MITVATLFASLEGKWHFQRVISNHGTIQGIARFQKGESETFLDYKEEGVWIQESGDSWNVYRSFLYSLENETISVYLKRWDKIPLTYIDPDLFRRSRNYCKCNNTCMWK